MEAKDNVINLFEYKLNNNKEDEATADAMRFAYYMSNFADDDFQQQLDEFNLIPELDDKPEG